MLLTDLKNAISDRSLQTGTDLCNLMIKEGSDKCSSWHNYTPIYSSLFECLRNDAIQFLEIGVFHGASARAWRQYFPNAKIHLADVEKSYLIYDSRFSSHICDQDDKESILNMWNEIGKESLFDIIIDDGKHEFFSNFNFLINSIQSLKPGGIFIIEDLTIDTWNMFNQRIDSLKLELSLTEICMLDIPSETNNIDNRLLIIRK
jgi:hypothetical protein